MYNNLHYIIGNTLHLFVCVLKYGRGDNCMKGTKERILKIALNLFAKDGYEAVSVSQISQELGMVKSALYKHYTNKRDIFNSILQRMEEKSKENSSKYDILNDEKECKSIEEKRKCIDCLVEYCKDKFNYWTKDEFASAFRKVITIEQFRNDDMAAYYQQYLAFGPLDFLMKAFKKTGCKKPLKKAYDWYAPVYLSYSMYDASSTPDNIIKNGESLIEQLGEAYKKEIC